MAGVHELARYRERESPQEFTAYLGMVVFLASWAMLFAALFFAYGLVRSRSPVWPPEGQPELPRLLPAVNTLVIAASSAAVATAVRWRSTRAGRGVAAATAIAAALGALFLGLQAVVWLGLVRQGLFPTAGPYASVFFGFTAFHALHVLVGVAALAVLAIAARRRGGVGRVPLRLWGLYWHFVGGVWLALYVAVFVL